MALGQNLVALVNIKIAVKLVFTPLTLIIIGFDRHPYAPFGSFGEIVCLVSCTYNNLSLTDSARIRQDTNVT